AFFSLSNTTTIILSFMAVLIFAALLGVVPFVVSTMPSVTWLWFIEFSLDGVCHAARGQGNRQPGEPAAEHTEAHQCADHPQGAAWPGPPDHYGENEADDPIDQKPTRPTQWAKLE